MSTDRHLNILLAPILALAGFLGLLLGIASATGITPQETLLNPNGSAYELNTDSQGTLWISDWSAGEIWSLEPTSGVTRTYQVGGGPRDARSDGAGSVWWADFSSNRLGRLSISTGQATLWEIPNSLSLYSTAISTTVVGSGDVWVSDSFDPYIYKLSPDTNQLCTYELPDSGVTAYLYFDGGQLWFGDSYNARIVRLQAGSFDWWTLPEGSYPQDLELDAQGRLWWTDGGKGYLGRLDTGAATITTFTPPIGDTPQMLALAGDKVWYSQQPPSQVVVLDPAVAAGQTTPVTTGSKAATPECSELLPLAPAPVSATSGPATWTGQTYATVLDRLGWTIYDMPETSAPWGIVAAEKIWLVDQGRQVLARLDPSAQVDYRTYLPMTIRS